MKRALTPLAPPANARHTPPMGTRDRTPRPKSSRYITPDGMRRLDEELHHLWHVERPKVVQGIAEAAAEGDRSENAEYIYGKKKLRELDRRITYLSKRVDELEVVNPGEGQRHDRVFFGAWVRVDDEDLGEERVIRIVGADEFDADQGFISIDSPVARSLLGKGLDDEVVVQRPKGETLLTVLEISYRGFDE